MNRFAIVPVVLALLVTGCVSNGQMTMPIQQQDQIVNGAATAVSAVETAQATTSCKTQGKNGQKGGNLVAGGFQVKVGAYNQQQATAELAAIGKRTPAELAGNGYIGQMTQALYQIFTYDDAKNIEKALNTMHNRLIQPDIANRQNCSGKGGKEALAQALYSVISRAAKGLSMAAVVAVDICQVNTEPTETAASDDQLTFDVFCNE